MALTLDQLVNTYGTYSGKTLIGEYGARATVPSRGFGDVKGVPYDNITFVVQVNGTKYASSKWLAQQQNGNPYLSSNTVARIDNFNIGNADFNYLDQKGKGERYSEMKASFNLKGDDKILSFINSLLDGSDDIKPASTWGSWSPNIERTVTVPTTIQDPLGNAYSIGVIGRNGNTYNADIDLEGIYPGLEFAETGFNGKIAGADALTTSTKVTQTEVDESPIDTGTGISSNEVVIERPSTNDLIIDITTPNPFTGGNNNFGGGTIIDDLTDYEEQELFRPRPSFGQFE